MRIDINCDMGESYGEIIIGNDSAIMPFISSANIACGFHGGDPLTIEKTICLALKYGVSVGAHPSYNDLKGFGRRPMHLSKAELRSAILYQVGALKSMTETLGGVLNHVKPHGALYNSASSNYEMSRVIAETIKEIDPSLKLVCLSQSKMIDAAHDVGLPYISEAFADRAYNDDGSLVSRDIPGAVITNEDKVVERVLLMITEGVVETINGKVISIQADTICIHGDNEQAPNLAKAIYSELTERGVTIR
ncbi:MAG: lactam utilization protein LamB [Bacteroidetes bacterium RIFOXYA12_FULL_40_10]|jgi:UPF0271 protein|nr:MAG: lactam utilization protein LamB [Bacteroidetes bacterium GWE2_40_15]OFY90488.1 MAG: lactam utilization protein LamB [Bacteroidetes bacterium RIFOXYA12_FULL_40_10]PKP07336.1 MAG: lactam utilization protein LamB [Bacteroidetes bacterium HGW-Bacteroidetes-5]HBZ26537.1 LamB/YcsF family protein [Rikenellaceae bacterium]